MKKLLALASAAMLAVTPAMAAQQETADISGASSTGFGDMEPETIGMVALGAAVAIAVIADGGSDDGGVDPCSEPGSCPEPPPVTNTSTSTSTSTSTTTVTN